MSETAPVAAVLLAAGMSTRAGPTNKLLHEVDGVPMVRRTAQVLLASRARPIVAVTGHQREAVAAALAGLDVETAHNSDYAMGMAGSLRRGLAALPETATGALVCLADMPDVAPATLDALIDAFDPAAGRAICVPVQDGRRGNPVLFARAQFPALMAIDGDRGGKAVLTAHKEMLADVPVDDPGIHIDHDRPG